jgi:hypothetical protein
MRAHFLFTQVVIIVNILLHYIDFLSYKTEEIFNLTVWKTVARLLPTDSNRFIDDLLSSVESAVASRQLLTYVTVG